MGMFEYVAVLTSIIGGLGITHLLQGTARMFQDPEAGRPCWVHLTWVFYMFLTAVFWWWWEFRLKHLETWTFQVYVFVILFAVGLYLLCAMLFPSNLDRYDGFRDYYYSRRAWFFGIFIVFQTIDVIDTLLKGEAYFASLGPEYIIGRALKIALCMDAYMREISANDLAAMDARQTPGGMTYRHVARADGGWDVVAHSNKYWVAPERADGHIYRERYWSPTVMIRGAMSMVWAPYEFQTDGATSHCGIDVFAFSKIDGVWKVSNSMWTVEPDACDELRPADPGEIRPRD